MTVRRQSWPTFSPPTTNAEAQRTFWVPVVITEGEARCLSCVVRSRTVLAERDDETGVTLNGFAAPETVWTPFAGVVCSSAVTVHPEIGLPLPFGVAKETCAGPMPAMALKLVGTEGIFRLE